MATWMAHVFALNYNMVRQFILAAARSQQVDVQRISFNDATSWLPAAKADGPMQQLVVNPD